MATSAIITNRRVRPRSLPESPSRNARRSPSPSCADALASPRGEPSAPSVAATPGAVPTAPTLSGEEEAPSTIGAPFREGIEELHRLASGAPFRERKSFVAPHL